MSIPTIGENFQKMLHHLREVQDAMATQAHLHGLQDNPRDAQIAKGWLICSEAMKAMQGTVTRLAQGRLQ